jgi:hypothetical protein
MGEPPHGGATVPKSASSNEDNMNFPLEILDQHTAVIGKTGSGKSFACRGLVELLLKVGRRVCVLDYTGVWSGLRSNAAGTGPGFPVVIFGGDHADVPLTEGAGPAIAKIVAEGNQPTVVDLDGLTVGAQQRFVTTFLEDLYRLNRLPLHLVIEEADEFAPQTGAPGAERMIGATCRIFQRGRKKGFRAIAITQRPANIHKRVLAQCNSLVAMRLLAPQDHKAVADWVRGHGDDEKGREVVGSLATLRRGDGWVWAPELGILKRMTFPPIKTFDSMRAPDESEAQEPVKWADIDLASVRNQMAAAIEEAKQNDPKALRAEVSRLTAALAKVNKNAAPPPVAATTKANLDAAYKHGLADGFNQGRKAMMDAAHEVFAGVIDQGEQMIACIRSMPNTLDHTELARLAFPSPETQSTGTPKPPSQVNRIPNGGDGVALRSTSHPIGPKTTRRSTSKESVETIEIDLPLTRPQRTVLAALAWWKALGHETVTRTQVAAKSGFKVGGGHFLNRLSELSRAGYIVYPGTSLVQITYTGIAAAPVPDMGVTVTDSIRAILTGPQLKLFDALLRQREMSREDLAAEAEFEPKGGHFLNRLSELSRMQIISFPARGQVTLQEWIR